MTTTETPSVWATIVAGLDAEAYVARYGNARGREELDWCRESGNLELVIGTDPDGFVWGQYARADRVRCWDGCDGIFTHHRAGWCPFVPEHADFDCGCSESYADFDGEDIDSESWDIEVASKETLLAMLSDDPF